MKKNIGIVITFFCIFIGLFLLVNKKKTSSDQILTVGMMSGWAPFMTINGQGEYEGFDVDVAQELAARMGKSVVIQDLGSLASCFIALEQGMVDMVMSGLDITKKRQESYAMIYYTGENVTQLSLAFWNVVPQSVQTIDDLSYIPNAIVCVESGSAQEKFLDKYPVITKKYMNSILDSLLDIRFGKSLAVLLESRIACRLQKKNSELALLSVPLSTDFQMYGCGIAIQKNQGAFIQSVEKIIREMREDGTVKTLEIKWQLEE